MTLHKNKTISFDAFSKYNKKSKWVEKHSYAWHKIKESNLMDELTLPGEFPSNFGSNIKGLKHFIKMKSIPNKSKQYIKIGDLGAFYQDKITLRNSLKIKARDFTKSQKSTHDLHIKTFIQNFIKANVVTEVDNSKILKSSKKLLKIKCVINDDNSTRFICFNLKQNKHLKIGAPLSDGKEIIADILKRKPKFMVKIDLVKGFFNIPIHPKCRHYYRFNFEGKQYEFNSLIMGSSDSPGIFQTLIYEHIILPSIEGIKGALCTAVNYEDDIVIYGDIYDEIISLRDKIINKLNETNCLINKKKSTIIPTDKIEILGHIIDLDTEVIELSNQKQAKILFHSQCFPIDYEKLKGSIGHYQEFLSDNENFKEDLGIPVAFSVFNKHFKKMFDNEKDIILGQFVKNLLVNISGISFKSWLVNYANIISTKYQLKTKIKINQPTGRMIIDFSRPFLDPVFKFQTRENVKEFLNNESFRRESNLKKIEWKTKIQDARAKINFFDIQMKFFEANTNRQSIIIRNPVNDEPLEMLDNLGRSLTRSKMKIIKLFNRSDVFKLLKVEFSNRHLPCSV